MGVLKTIFRRKCERSGTANRCRSDDNKSYNQKDNIVKGQQFVNIDFSSWPLMFNF